MRIVLSYFYLRLQAIVLLLLGQTHGALRKFDAMLILKPLDRYALASRAYVVGQLGDKSTAIVCLERLVAGYPDNSAAWFNLGYMLEDSARHAEAELAFRRATELDSAMDRAWYGLALVLIQARRFDEAVEALQKNTQLQPMNPYGWYQLARVHVDRQAPQEAARIIRHLRGFEPKVAAQLERETGLGSAPASLPG